jgi:hypothetical protein
MRKQIIFISLFIIAVMLYYDSCHAQSKNDKWIYACEFISGCADGVNQADAAWHIGKGNRFWDYRISFTNKYKDFPTDKRAAYLGSKGLLAWTTDGYHLTRFIDRSFQLGAIGFSLTEKNNWKQIIKKVIVSVIINRAGFCLWYNIIY